MCLHCLTTFETTQGRGLHFESMHPCPDRLLRVGPKDALTTGRTITTPPWHGIGARRCLIIRFYHTWSGVGHALRRTETVSFQLQPRRQGDANDDIANDEFGPEIRKVPDARRSEKRRRCYQRQKTSVVAELRELEESKRRSVAATA